MSAGLPPVCPKHGPILGGPQSCTECERSPLDGGTVTPLRRVAPIGGSEAAAAAGIDPHHSRVMLWLEKTGRIERQPSEAMEWGTLLEPVILGVLAERGYDVQAGDGLALTDPGRPWITGHPDGFTTVDGEAALLEVKTAGVWAARADAWEGDGLPIAYEAQLQHYLHLTGLSRYLLAVLIGGQRLELREGRRDERAIELLLRLEEEFWTEYVLPDRQPPPGGTDSDRDALAALYPHARPGEVVRLDAEHVGLYRDLLARRRQGDAIDRQRAELENRLKAFIGDAETAIDRDDNEVLRWTNYTRNAIDSKRLKRERPDIAEQYQTTTTGRRFTVA